MNRRHFMKLSAIAAATVLVPTDTVAKSDYPVIDMGGSDTALELRNYSGGITIKDVDYLNVDLELFRGRGLVNATVIKKPISELYINGELEGYVESYEDTISSVLTLSMGAISVIMPEAGVSSMSIWLNIDEYLLRGLKTWDRELTPAEVAVLYEVG